MKRFGYDKIKVAFLACALSFLFCADIMAGEVRKVGGFVAVQRGDGSWDGGLPSCLKVDAPDVKGAEMEANKPDLMVMQLSSLSMPWIVDGVACAIPLVSDVPGSNITMRINAMGTLAASPNLSLYKDQSLTEGNTVSFLLGSAGKALPDSENCRVVGLCIAYAKVSAVMSDENHPLYGFNGNKGKFLFATMQYVDSGKVDGNVSNVSDLQGEGLHTINFFGVKLDDSDSNYKVYECRLRDSSSPEHLTGSSQMLAGNTLTFMSINSSVTGSTQKYTIPRGVINSIVPINLTTDLSMVQFGSPTGTVLVGELPGFELPVHGISEKLRFGSPRLSFTLGANHLGSQKSLSIEATLENPGILFGSLGDEIGVNKKVGLTIEGDMVIINFYNTLEDLKPFGFSLKNPVVSINTDEKSIDLAGIIAFPDNLPIPLTGKNIDVSGHISKDNLNFTLMTDMELSIFNDSVRMGMDTIVVGMCEKQVYFSCVGHARFVNIPDQIKLIPNLNVSTKAEFTANLFVQTDGTMHAELSGDDILSVNAGPIKTTLEEVALILDHTPGQGWYASVSGTGNLNIKASPFELNVTTKATVDTNGSVVVEIPHDEENPTKISLGDLSVTIAYGKLAFAKNADGAYGVEMDATVTTRLPDEIPMIGGQDLTGHMMAKSDGSFVFELTEIPLVYFCNMGVGLTDLRIENRKENGVFLLSFEAGAGVEFQPNFVVQPLRNQTVKGKVTVSSDLSAKFSLEGMMLSIKDFEFGIEEIAISVIKGRDIAISGTAALAVKYPSSKYLGVGLPAALAKKENGPDFNIKGTVSMSMTNIYFSASSTAMEVPIDIPDVVEGITIGLEKVGVGITYAGIPLFDLRGSLYLPDLSGGGKTGTTPALGRPYDSKIAIALTCNVQDGLVVGLDIEGTPKLKVEPLFEMALYQARLGSWLYGFALTFDVGGKFQVGKPNKGFGAVFDLKGCHVILTSIPMPYYDNCLAMCNYGGFGFGLETEFPRPKLTDVQEIIAIINILKNGRVSDIFTECGDGGKFNSLFPRFSVKQAYLRIPKPVAKLIHVPNKLDCLFGGKIDISATKVIPHLAPLIEAVANPKDTMANLIALVPEDKRAGKFNATIGVGKFHLLSGGLNYKLQARERVFIERKVPKLADVMRILNIINEVETKPTANSIVQWKIVRDDNGYIRLQNRNSGLFLALAAKGKDKAGDLVLQRNLDEKDESFCWSEGAKRNGAINLYNRRSGMVLVAQRDGSASQTRASSVEGNQWMLSPVFGTDYYYLLNQGQYLTGKALGATRTDDGAVVQVTTMQAKQQVTALGKSVEIAAGEVELQSELEKAYAFITKLESIPAKSTTEFYLKLKGEVGNKASGDMVHGYNVKLTGDTLVRVMPTGKVSIQIAQGALELRTELKNMPKVKLEEALDAVAFSEKAALGRYPYDGITTPRNVTMGNPDCYAAKTWKNLWDMRNRSVRPKVSGNTIHLSLNNGLTASLEVKAKCRSLTRVSRTQTIFRRRFVSYFYKRAINTINAITVDSSGRILLKYDDRISATRDNQFVLFDPKSTDKTGKTGIVNCSKNASSDGILPTGISENSALDPKYTFTISDGTGWTAELANSETVAFITPENARMEAPLVPGLDNVMALLTGEGESTRKYGSSSDARWYFVSSETGAPLTGTSSSASAILEKTGPSVTSRALTWKGAIEGKPQTIMARISNGGALTGLHSLKVKSGSESSLSVAHDGVRHQISVSRVPVANKLEEVPTDNSLAVREESQQSPMGPYQATVYIEKDGNLTPVQITDEEKGIVLDPAFRTIPTGLDLSGKLAIGNQLLIKAAYAFAGHIDEDGGVALSASGNIVCHGFKLTGSQFSFRHFPDGRDNGLTFSGETNAPFKGRLKGEIYENGNFHVAGNVRMLVPGVKTTGFIGSVCLDPRSSYMRGAIYVAGTKVLSANINIRNGMRNITVTSRLNVKIGTGGYKKRIGFWKVRIPYTGIKAGIESNMYFKFQEPMSISGRLRFYGSAKLLDRNLGSFNKSYRLPDICRVNRTRVIGRNAEFRLVPFYMWFDGPSKFDIRIGRK